MTGIRRKFMAVPLIFIVLSASFPALADWQDRMVDGTEDDYDIGDSESRDGAICSGISGGLNESSLQGIRNDASSWQYYAIMEDGSMKAVEEDLQFEYEIAAHTDRYDYHGQTGTAVNLADGTFPVDIESVSTDTASYPAVKVKGRNVPGTVYVILKYSAVEKGDHDAALRKAREFKEAVDGSITDDEIMEAAVECLGGTVFTADTLDVFQTAFLSASLGTTSTAQVVRSLPNEEHGYRFTRTGRYRIYSPTLTVSGSTEDHNGFYGSLSTGDFSGPCFALTQKYMTYEGTGYWAVSDLLSSGSGVDYYFSRRMLLGSIIYENQVETGQRDREADIDMEPIYEVDDTISAENARHYIEPEPGILDVDPLELGTRDIAENLQDSGKYGDLKATAASFYSLMRTLSVCGLLISFMTGGIMLMISGQRARKAVSESLLCKCVILVIITGFAGFVGLAVPAIASVAGTETSGYEAAKEEPTGMQEGEQMNYWYYEGTE